MGDPIFYVTHTKPTLLPAHIRHQTPQSYPSEHMRAHKGERDLDCFYSVSPITFTAYPAVSTPSRNEGRCSLLCGVAQLH